MKTASLFPLPLLALLTLGAGCVNALSEEGRPCPCDTGWTCCESTQACIREGTTCAALNADTVPPAAPVLTTSLPDVPTQASAVTLEGLAEAGATVELFTRAGCAGTPVLTAPVDAAGAFHFSAPLPPNTPTAFHALARDSAGNASPCAVGPRLTQDSLAPAAPVLTGPAAFTAFSEPDATGTTEPGARVRLFAGLNCLGEPVAEAAAHTDGTFLLPVRAERNAANALSARVTDAAGNTSGCSAPRRFTHDGVAPALPEALSLLTPSPTNETTTPTLSGRAEPGSTVRVYSGTGTCEASAARAFSTTADAQGRFTLQVEVTPDARTPLSVLVEDAAGNRSPCAWNMSFVHDGRAPTAPVLLGASRPSPTTVDAPFHVHGSAEHGATVRLYASPTCSGPVVASATVGGPKNLFSEGDFLVRDVTAAPEATTVFHATASDALGNTSACSSTAVVYTHTKGRGWDALETPGSVETTAIVRSRSGHTLAVWERQDASSGDSALLASFHTAAGGWSAPEELAMTLGLDDEVFAVADSGHAFVAWSAYVRLRLEVHVRRFIPGEGWQPVEFVRAGSTAHASAPRLAVDAAGNAFLSWREDGKLQVSRFTQAHGWGTPHAFPYVGTALDPRHLVASGNGDAWAFWSEQPDSKQPAIIRGSHYTPATGWGPLERHLEELPPLVGTLGFAADDAGGAVMAWYGTAPGIHGAQVWARHFEPGKGWGEPRRLSVGQEGSYPQLAVNARGDAVVAWSRTVSAGSPDEVWATTFSPGTGWSAPARMQHPAGTFSSLQAPVIDGSGAALVAWQQRYGALRGEYESSYPNRNLLVARFEPGTGWRPAQPLLDVPSPSHAFFLGMAEQGDALVLWSRLAEDGARVTGSRWFR